MATPSLPDEPADPELRVRFTTATALVNELVEARAANILSRALGRWERIELIGIDELGYVPLAEIGAELLFQVIADREELPVHAVGDLPPGVAGTGPAGAAMPALCRLMMPWTALHPESSVSCEG
jgi:IstB-like ATP binding protein